MPFHLHRRWLPPLVLATILSLIAGCTDAAQQSSDSAPAVQVTAADGGSASVGGATVSIPPGAVDQAANLTVMRGEAPAAGAAGEYITPIGQALEVELVGARLTAPATVTLPVDPAELDGTTRIPVVVWQDTADTWRWLPTTWQPGSTEVSAQTDHFSGGFVGTVNVDALAGRAVTAVRDYLTGRSGVAQPSCGDEQAARRALTIASDGGDTTKWCLGVEDGRTVIKIANNRRTYATITYPATWQVLDGGGGGISLDALVRSTAGGLGEVAAPRGQAVRIVSGGDTLTFALPAGTGGAGQVSVTTDLIAWSLSGIVMAVDVFTFAASAARRSLGAAGDGLGQRLIAMAASGSVEGFWRDAWDQCIRAISDNLTDHPLDPLTNWSLASDTLKAVWGCGPSLAKAYLAGTGAVTGFLAAAALTFVASVASAVLTAANLLITGARELVDTFASFSGRSDPLYDIVVRGAGPPAGAATLTYGAYGGAVVGMSRAEVEQAVGELPVREFGGLDGCDVLGDPDDLDVGDGPAFTIYRSADELIGMTPDRQAHTRAGIGLGDAAADVQRAYPQLMWELGYQATTWVGIAVDPAHPDRALGFVFEEADPSVEPGGDDVVTTISAGSPDYVAGYELCSG
ncbi:hypothetical protein ACWKWC_01595 [Geodermatophilus nigrescens]